MTMFLAPYTAIADIDGSPLDAGFLFFGEYGKDPISFPVEVFWDSEFTVPAAQPIRTRNGYPVRNGSPTKVYLKTAQHSIVIKNRNNAFILADFENKGRDEGVAYFYNTTLEMIANNSLSSGAVVATKGYHNIFDDGGATYLISSAATDYSIPLNNGLYAIFRDAFDVRKFGVVSSPTLDQTENLKRLVAYADTREYSIDFHGFTIRPPDIPQFRTAGKANLNCLGFNYLHDIRNLTMVHDKTVQLQSGKCLLGFYPKSNLNGTFKLTNVKFDPWVSNHNFIDPITGTRVGEGDGSMHGFSTFPHPEWEDYRNFAESFTDISFELDNVEFLSSAVCYNIELARIPAKKVTLKNIRGDYLALMVHQYTKLLIGDDVHGVYRDDLHAPGRILVTNLIHCEPAMVSGKHIKIDDVLLTNMSSVTKSTGVARTVYRYYAMGLSTEINSIVSNNVKGLVGTNVTVDTSYPFHISKFEILNSKESGFSGEFSSDLVAISNSNLSSNIMPSRKSWGEFEAVNSTLNTLFYDSSSLDLATHGNFSFKGSTFTNERGFGYSRDSNRWFKSLTFDSCKFARYVAETGFEVMNIISGEIAKSESYGAVGNAITPTKVFDGFNGKSEINIIGMQCKKNQIPGLYYINGAFASSREIKVKTSNMVLATRFNWIGDGVVVNQFNTVRLDGAASKNFDPSSLAAGAIQSTTIAVSCEIGDSFDCSFSQPLMGTRMWAEVTSANLLTVYHHNPTATAVDLPSGILVVKLI